MKPSDLGPDRWRRIDAILDRVLDAAPEDVDAVLAEACAGDADLRGHVEALLGAVRPADDVFEGAARTVAAAIAGSALSSEVEEGRSIGPFRIEREIGRGGMGVVYLAEDTRLGRRVALKVLPPYLSLGGESARRFASEAKVVSTLDHPNVATLYETDLTEAGQRYLVFAFYEGETLRDRIERGSVPPEEAADIVGGLAAGLDAAHRHGIVHRDVKPSNVLLTVDGEVKLLDFGVATIAGEELGPDVSPLGTAAYMSPEQVRGEPVDHRSDLWSVGAVLYEMLTGTRPFAGSTVQAILSAVVDDDVAPLPAGLSTPGVARVLERALEKRAEDRYQSAEELLRDVHLALGVERSVPGEAGGGESSGWRRPHPIGIGLVGLAGLAAGMWWLARDGPGAEGVDRLAVLPFEDLADDSGRGHVVAGVHAALTTELGLLGTVDVVSRASVARFVRLDLTIDEIAAELGVDAVVAGSVATDGDEVIVVAELLAVAPERLLWADQLRAPISGVPEVSRTVARAIAETIGGAADGDVTSAADAPVDPEAYEAYLRGVFNMGRANLEGFQLAERYFREAIRLDSTFADAYANLAEVMGQAAFFGLRAPVDVVPDVVTLVEAALAIDSTQALAHTRRGAVRLFWERDPEGAERSARRALALNPSLAEGHRLLAEALAARGIFAEALSAVERASELDRWSQFSAFRPAIILYYMRDFEAAADHAREGLSFVPEFWQGHWLLCLSLAAQGRSVEGLPSCEEAVTRSGDTPMATGALGYAYAVSGESEAAVRIADELERRASVQYVAPMFLAMIHAGLGDPDRAFEWLERARDERDLGLVQVTNHFFFDVLHPDPRFAGLLRTMEPAVPGA